jgi:hypothetical protein
MTTLVVPTVRKISTAGFAVQTHGARPKCLSYVRICQLSHVTEIKSETLEFLGRTHTEYSRSLRNSTVRRPRTHSLAENSPLGQKGRWEEVGSCPGLF